MRNIKTSREDKDKHIGLHGVICGNSCVLLRSFFSDSISSVSEVSAAAIPLVREIAY